MEKVNLYKQHNAPIQLVLATTGRIINNPMYNRDIQLYKGIVNKVEFSIKTQDRKALSLQDKKLFLYFQKMNGSEKWVKALYAVNTRWGVYEVSLSAQDLEDLDAGFYNGYMLAVNDEGEEEILYTGANWETRLQIEVISGQYNTFVQSQEIRMDNWTYQQLKDDRGLIVPYYISDVIKANKSSNQGFAFYFENYLGEITILGTNDSQPMQDLKDWYEIDKFTFDEPTNITLGKFYQIATQWIRIKSNPKSINQGKITQILYRN